MANPTVNLADPLTLGGETISRGAWSNGKFIALLSLIGGLVFVVFFAPVAPSGYEQHSAAEEDAITMYGAKLANPSRSYVGQGMPSCPNVPKLSIPAIEEGLKNHGILPTPMSRLALTQLAATRDVTMKAKAKELFESMDSETKDKLLNMQKNLVVRAVAKYDKDALINTLAPEDMAGQTAPFGYWDPLNFGELWGDKTRTGIKASAGTGLGFKGTSLWGLRLSELKHGRVCMLAALGFAFNEKFHPLMSDSAGFVSSAATHFTPEMKLNFWPALWTIGGTVDLLSSFYEDPNTVPGDMGFDPLGLKPKDPAAYMEMQNKELNNGRLAMFAIMGMMGQEMATGKRIF